MSAVSLLRGLGMISPLAQLINPAAVRPRPRSPAPDARASSPPPIEDDVTTERYLAAAGMTAEQIAQLVSLGYKPGQTLSKLTLEDRKHAGIKPFEWIEICDKEKAFRAKLKAANM